MSDLLTKPTSDVASNGAQGSGETGPNGSPSETSAAPRACTKCGLPLQDGQDWCLQCGTGAPGSLSGGPGWRTGIAILATTALLVIGASVAAYAALNKTKPKVAVVAVTGLGTTTSSTTAPGTTPTPATPGTTPTPGATSTPGTPTTVKATPPIPSQTPTPVPSGGANTEANNSLFPPETKTTKTPSTTTTPTKTSGESTKGSKESAGSEGSEPGSETGAEAPSPILLDTDAASVYNPYAYPAALFGDPSLAIDGEASTAWTAQVQPTVAPKMAEGLVLDLKSPQKLGSVAVKTTTPGITVEVYGAVGKTLPASISDPAWNRIVGLKVLKKKNTTLALKKKGNGYRYIVLWLAQAPAPSTAATPGTVAINEFELFP